MLLVYLDRYHLGDPLFINGLAQHVKAHQGPLLLIHGGGEDAERALEAAGLPPAGPVEHTWEAAALVERATRELGRRIVHALNDAGVSGLRLAGTDRALLRRTADGVEAGRTDWLATLVGQGVVPVIALLATDGETGETVEIRPEEALAGLVRAFGASASETPRSMVLLFPGAGGREAEALDPAAPGVGDALVRMGIPVRVARPAALRGAGTPIGTDLRAEPASGV